MTIQLSAIQRLGKGPVTALIEYQNLPGLKLLIEFMSRTETAEFYGTADGGDARDVTDEEFRDWHLDKVKGWEGVDDGDSPASFDRSVVGTLWDNDPRFQTWLTGGCRRLGAFLESKDAPVALAVGASSD